MSATIDGSLGVDLIQSGTVSNTKIVDGSVTPSKLSQPLTLGTAQNTTSGTSIDFTGIPSWVKRITVMFNGVSTNGTSQHMLQIGSGTISTTGYNSSCSTNGATSSNLTSGFWVHGRADAANAAKGLLVLTHLGSNNWICSGNVSSSTGVNYDVWASAGSLTLNGTLDRIRLTTVNGTDTFDAGSVNILYE